MVHFKEVQGHSFLGVISRRPTLQVLSCGMFDHLLEVHRKLSSPGGNLLWHNSLKLCNIIIIIF